MSRVEYVLMKYVFTFQHVWGHTFMTFTERKKIPLPLPTIHIKSPSPSRPSTFYIGVHRECVALMVI